MGQRKKKFTIWSEYSSKIALIQNPMIKVDQSFRCTFIYYWRLKIFHFNIWNSFAKNELEMQHQMKVLNYSTFIVTKRRLFDLSYLFLSYYLHHSKLGYNKFIKKKERIITNKTLLYSVKVFMFEQVQTKFAILLFHLKL